MAATAASAFAARPTCPAAAPTEGTGGGAGTWWWSATRPSATWPRFTARGTSAPGAAVTGEASSSTVRAATTRRSWCRRAPRSRASSCVATTSSTRASAPWWRPAGLGGHGNKRFASSTRQAPRFAERGLGGESGWIELRLKLLADAGLVGQPNAGKSSLLRRLTRAAPKVAAYPFTTVEPVLGTLEFDDRQLVLADIPGLIEGAAQGAGLGHEFLAHVERCGLLVHLIDVAGDDPAAAHAAVREELRSYGAGLELLPELIVLSKRDLVPGERADELVAEWSDRLAGTALGVLAVSSVDGAGIEQLRRAILEAVPEGEGKAVQPASDAEPRFEAEHIVYRPEGDQGFDVERVEDGVFEVRGRGIELLVARHDLENPEALAYLEQRLGDIGVLAALRSAGFEPGDEVRIGELAFELLPDQPSARMLRRAR